MKFKQTFAAVIAISALLQAPALAGVVFEVETTYHSNHPGLPKVETSLMSVEKPNLKMEIAPGDKTANRGAKEAVIFKGDSRTMVVVNHEEQYYMVMDPATMQRIGGQMDQAMKQLEIQMEGLDPAQRAMMEKMLKGKMRGAAAIPSPIKREKTEIRKSTERATKQGYPCVKYEMLRGGELVQELWVTDWSNVKGGKDVAETFRNMAGLLEEIASPMLQMVGGDRSSLDVYSKIDGFPVVTKTFDGGELEIETNLGAVIQRDLDPAGFAPPKGYKLRKMEP